MTARFLAFCWAILFAVVHTYWALDGRLGLPSNINLRTDWRLLTADLIAIPLCLLAACCVHTFRSGRSAMLTTAQSIGTAIVALLCLAHAVPPLLSVVAITLKTGAIPYLSERDSVALGIYEPYWLAGGILFAIAWAKPKEQRRTGRSDGGRAFLARQRGPKGDN